MCWMRMRSAPPVHLCAPRRPRAAPGVRRGVLRGHRGASHLTSENRLGRISRSWPSPSHGSSTPHTPCRCPSRSGPPFVDEGHGALGQGVGLAALLPGFKGNHPSTWLVP